MRTNRIKTLLIFALLMSEIVSGYAQSKGVLTGVITDKSTGSSLPGATIIIAGSNQGTITRIEGDYTLANIPEGSNKIVFSFVSYKSDTIDVNIVAGKTQVLDVALSADNFGLDEVIITAQLLGQKKAINRQLQSDAIMSIVSIDKIRELPDVNAAEAIARLPGIALQRSGGEGQKVIIRGLAPKFTAVTINGIRMPANSNTNRSVDLSLISPELLGGIEVYKSVMPDLDAEALAGTVNLRLIKAREGPRFSAKLLGGYNNVGNTYDDYKAVVSASNRFFDNNLGVSFQASTERFNRSGDFINTGWTSGASTEGFTPLIGSTRSFVDKIESRKRHNGSLSLDYSLGDANDFSLFGIFSRTSTDALTNTVQYGAANNTFGFSGNGSYNKLDLGMLMFSAEHQISSSGIKLDWTVARSNSRGDNPYDASLSLTTPPSIPINYYFENDKGNEITVDDGVHPREFPAALTTDFGAEDQFISRDAYNTSKVKEQVSTALANLEIPLQLGDNFKVTIKTGSKYQATKRSRNVRRFYEPFFVVKGNVVNPPIIAAYQEATGETLNTYEGQTWITMDNFISDKETRFLPDVSPVAKAFPYALDKAKFRTLHDVIKNNNLFGENLQQQYKNYTADESVLAFYMLLKLQIGSKLTLMPGLRYEYSDNQYIGTRVVPLEWNGVSQVKDSTINISYGELFPHFHVKYDPFKWLNIRGAYSTSIARPDYTWLVPGATINTGSALTISSAGNPNLKHSVASNIDIFASAHKSGWGIVTVGAFYKDIKNYFTPRTFQLLDDSGDEPVEIPEFGAGYMTFPDRAGYQINTYVNLPESSIWGFEFDLQSNFSRILPYPWSGLVFNVNYARLYSETTDFNTTRETTFTGFPPRKKVTITSTPIKISLPSQTPHVFGASIGYDLGGFSARLSSSYQSDRTVSLSVLPGHEKIGVAFWRFDASVKQKIGKNWSAFLNLNNISSQKDIVQYALGGAETRTSVQAFGPTATLGFQYKFTKN